MKKKDEAIEKILQEKNAKKEKRKELEKLQEEKARLEEQKKENEMQLQVRQDQTNRELTKMENLLYHRENMNQMAHMNLKTQLDAAVESKKGDQNEILKEQMKQQAYQLKYSNELLKKENEIRIEKEAKRRARESKQEVQAKYDRLYMIVVIIVAIVVLRFLFPGISAAVIDDAVPLHF